LGLMDLIAIGNSAAAAFEEVKLSQDNSGGKERLKKFTLNVLEEPVHVVIGVTNEPVRLADIVPLARKMSAKITEIALDSAIRNGTEIPCAKGCSACCSYLTPLPVPEAHLLREEIAAMPSLEQMRIIEACISVARHMAGEPAEIPPSHHSEPPPSNSSGWNLDLGLPCPFLRNDLCTIYENRPLVCREYFAIGCRGNCISGNGWENRLELPVRMSKVLRRLTAELEGTTPEAVILPLAPFWSDENMERANRMWPLTLLVERFIEIVSEELAQSDLRASKA